MRFRAEGEERQERTCILAVHRSHSALGDPSSVLDVAIPALAAAAAPAAALALSASSAARCSSRFLSSSFCPSTFFFASSSTRFASASRISLAFFSASSPRFRFSSITRCFSPSSFSACTILASIEDQRALFRVSKEVTSAAWDWVWASARVARRDWMDETSEERESRGGGELESDRERERWKDRFAVACRLRQTPKGDAAGRQTYPAARSLLFIPKLELIRSSV